MEGASELSPFHMGRAFICYRDINRAIERHRELYGVRLSLKKAVKLEDYHVTVAQLKALNFRLKYGELDYQCSLDSGRPGRPINGDRCPNRIRLKLSPDAMTLVVYESHPHSPLKLCDSLSPFSHSPQFQNEEVPSPFTSDETCTPVTCKTGPEKLTLKIKKSQFSPNEMVVVGSPRDAQEQMMKNPHSVATKSSHAVNSDASVQSSSSDKLTTTMAMTQELPAVNIPKVNEPVSEKHLVKMVSNGKLGKLSLQSSVVKPTLKPHLIVKKSTNKILDKPVQKAFDKNHALNKPNGNTKSSLIGHIKDRISINGNVLQKRVSKDGDKALMKSSGKKNGIVSSTSSSANANSQKATIHKKIKKKKDKVEDIDLTSLVSLDTELGLSEKQTLAQGVLLKLLRVTSHLPMIEFSHALEIFDTLTDALKLNQRVQLSINTENNDLSNSLECDEYEDTDNLNITDGCDPKVSSSTDTPALICTQVDGSCDFEDYGCSSYKRTKLCDKNCDIYSMDYMTLS